MLPGVVVAKVRIVAVAPTRASVGTIFMLTVGAPIIGFTDTSHVVTGAVTVAMSLRVTELILAVITEEASKAMTLSALVFQQSAVACAVTS